MARIWSANSSVSFPFSPATMGRKGPLRNGPYERVLISPDDSKEWLEAADRQQTFARELRPVAHLAPRRRSNAMGTNPLVEQRI